MKGKVKSILDLLTQYPDEQTCIKHLETKRWKYGIISPFDQSSKVYKCTGNRYKCKNTGKYFNVRTGTMFDNTKIPLQKWFLSIWLITAHKKGISSAQLSRDIGVTQKTAWFMLHRIRNCFDNNLNFLFNTEIEIDETYVGGKRNREQTSTKKARGRSTKKQTPVLGMVERKGGVFAKVVPNTGKNTIQPEVVKRIKKNATIYTDGWLGYKGLSDRFDHKIINHSIGEYVNGVIHTNTIEGFWSLMKRGILGIYHCISDKHLQKYVNEFSFRYNTRNLNDPERIDVLLNDFGVRTTYKSLKHQSYLT